MSAGVIKEGFGAAGVKALFAISVKPLAHGIWQRRGSQLRSERKSAMNQRERREYLIRRLLTEREEYKTMIIPETEEEQWILLRSLLNVREPAAVDLEFLRVQDEYLRAEIEKNGITDLADLRPAQGNIYLWQGDITRIRADVIVNAANSQMLGCFAPCHLCIDNAIHTFAGVQLRKECDRQMKLLRNKYGMNYQQPTAVPMLTDAYNLPAKKVIHIVGPIVGGELTAEHEKELADCYQNTLAMCAENRLKTVAFCCISTGVFMFPNKRAAEIAVSTVSKWLAESPGQIDKVIFNVFKDEDREIYSGILNSDGE